MILILFTTLAVLQLLAVRVCPLFLSIFTILLRSQLSQPRCRNHNLTFTLLQREPFCSVASLCFWNLKIQVLTIFSIPCFPWQNLNSAKTCKTHQKINWDLRESKHILLDLVLGDDIGKWLFWCQSCGVSLVIWTHCSAYILTPRTRYSSYCSPAPSPKKRMLLC